MSDQLTSPLASRFAHELATALTASIGVAATPEPATNEGATSGFVLSVRITGTQAGTIVAWTGASVAEAAASAATGTAAAPSLDVVLGLLRETATHACAIVALVPEFSGLRFNLTAVTPGPAPVGSTLLQFPIRDGATGVVGATATIDDASETWAARPGNNNLDLVLDVELPLVVRFGRTIMSLKALAGLGPGSIVDMGRSPDEPVELLVSDKVIAFGEVVIVDGSYGLRITDLVSRPDRLRALES